MRGGARAAPSSGSPVSRVGLPPSCRVRVGACEGGRRPRRRRQTRNGTQCETTICPRKEWRASGRFPRSLRNRTTVLVDSLPPVGTLGQTEFWGRGALPPRVIYLSLAALEQNSRSPPAEAVHEQAKRAGFALARSIRMGLEQHRRCAASVSRLPTSSYPASVPLLPSAHSNIWIKDELLRHN
jgi:hypothetical protein